MKKPKIEFFAHSGVIIEKEGRGSASIAWIAFSDHNVLAFARGFIGDRAAAEAEYISLIAALRYSIDRGYDGVTFYASNARIIESINGLREEDEAFMKYRNVIFDLKEAVVCNFEWIYKLENQSADQLVQMTHKDKTAYHTNEVNLRNKKDPLITQLGQKHYAALVQGGRLTRT